MPVKKSKVGRPKLTAAQKRKNAASKKVIHAKSQATKKTPTKRLKKRRAKNKATGYFPNPVFKGKLHTAGILYANGACETEYFFTGNGLDSEHKKAAIFRTARAALYALECFTSHQRKDIDGAEKFLKSFTLQELFSTKKKV